MAEEAKSSPGSSTSGAKPDADSVKGRILFDLKNRWSRDSDFIAEQLRDLKATDRARTHAASAHVIGWLTLFMLIAVLTVGVLILSELRSRAPTTVDINESITNIENRQTLISTALTRIDSRISSLDQTIIDIDARHASLGVRLESLLGKVELALGRTAGAPGVGTMMVEQWETGEFDLGSHECASINNGASRDCGLQNISVDGAASNRELMDVIKDPSRGPAIVLLVGGHDATPLRGALRRKYGSNTQLAQMRADSVRMQIQDSMKGKAMQPVWFFSVARSASTLGWPTKSDRTVTVSIVRMGKA